MTEMIKKLEGILSNLEYGNSELDTAKNDLPDYRTNESSRTQLEQGESYFESATSDLEKLISHLLLNEVSRRLTRRKGVK